MHYGSIGHGMGGALGFCAATGMRAVVLTGDGNLDLMSPMRVAVKHGLLLTVVRLNHAGRGLPFFASGRSGMLHAQATMPLPAWDFTHQGSPLVGGRRVSGLGEIDDAMSDALAADGCYVLDVQVDSEVAPPIAARLDSVNVLPRPDADERSRRYRHPTQTAESPIGFERNTPVR